MNQKAHFFGAGREATKRLMANAEGSFALGLQRGTPPRPEG